MLSGALHSALQESRGSLRSLLGAATAPFLFWSHTAWHSLSCSQSSEWISPARAAAIRHILSLGRYGCYLVGRLYPGSLCLTLHGFSFPSPSLRVWDPCVWRPVHTPKGRERWSHTIPWALQPNTGFRATPPFHSSPSLTSLYVVSSVILRQNMSNQLHFFFFKLTAQYFSKSSLWLGAMALAFY